MIDVEGFEGLYAITSCGKVWSYRSKRFMTPQVDKMGYMRVNLHKDGKIHCRYIHRMVAQAYIPNPEGKKTVDHIDSIKDHNYVSNLQWLTPGENASRSNTGRKRYWSTKVRPIYCVELDQVFESQSEACRQLRLSAAPLNYALNGKRKTCGGYHWKYVEEVAE